VSAVRFCSTRLKTLSVSLARGPLAAIVASGTSSRERRLVLEKFVGCTSPTSVHRRYIVVRYFDTHKNDIYKRN
jgi:hypothetical protein